MLEGVNELTISRERVPTIKEIWLNESQTAFWVFATKRPHPYFIPAGDCKIAWMAE